MKITRPLDSAFGDSARLRIIRCLMLAQQPLTGREIARQTHITPWAAIKVLRILENSGLIEMKRAGRANLYSLRKETALFIELLSSLFKRESRFVEFSVEWLLGRLKQKPFSIILFGSIARGNEREESDIDLLFVVKSPDEKKRFAALLSQIGSEFQVKFGKKISPYILTIEEFRRQHRKQEGVVKNAIEQGVVVYGRPLTEVLL